VASGEWLTIGVGSSSSLELLEFISASLLELLSVMLLDEDTAALLLDNIALELLLATLLLLLALLLLATLELLALELDETATLELLALLLELDTATEELEPVLPQSDSGINFTSSLYAAFLLPLASKTKGFLLLRQDWSSRMPQITTAVTALPPLVKISFIIFL